MGTKNPSTYRLKDYSFDYCWDCRAVVPRRIVGLSYHGSRIVVSSAAAEMRQPYKPTRLFHHKFSRFTVNGDEIHTIGQIAHADLLFFRRDLAFHHGLADGIDNAVGFHL